MPRGDGPQLPAQHPRKVLLAQQGSNVHSLAPRGPEQREGTQLIPGKRAVVRGLDRAMPISVIPYLSSRVWPVTFLQASSTGRGRAADPETINLAGTPEATSASQR